MDTKQEMIEFFKEEHIDRIVDSYTKNNVNGFSFGHKLYLEVEVQDSNTSNLLFGWMYEDCRLFGCNLNKIWVAKPTHPVIETLKQLIKEYEDENKEN